VKHASKPVAIQRPILYQVIVKLPYATRIMIDILMVFHQFLFQMFSTSRFQYKWTSIYYSKFLRYRNQFCSYKGNDYVHKIMDNKIMTINYSSILSPLSLWLVSLIALSLFGCSTQKTAPPQIEPVQQRKIADKVEQKPNAEQIMVDDLLSAIVQLFPPPVSTIQISAANNNELTLLVADTMAQSGFGIQKVTTDQGASLLTTETQTEEQSGNQSPIKQIRIDIGQVSIGRSYSLTNDQTVQPSSPFKVFGSRAKIDLDATLFGAVPAMTITQYVAPIKLDEPLPLLSLITPEVVQSSASGNTGEPELTSINSAKVEVTNLHFGESAFDSVLDNHLLEDNLTVIFPNDSLTLGNENKLIIRQFMKRFVEQLDLVSVVGCSNGPTNAEIGNVGLALGRGERVTDELLSLGVPRENILDQGCWAPSAGGKYPGRGVVLELWREKS